MISRRDALKLGTAGAFGLVMTNAAHAMAGALPPRQPHSPGAAGDLDRLTSYDLRALPPLRPARSVRKTGKTKTFTLTLATASVEPLAGHTVSVRGVNGMSPGPTLRVTEGDDMIITVVNRLTMGASIHWHGIPVPFLMDGAAMISQRPIAPDESFTYRFTAPQAGTYMYHSHLNDLE